MNGSLFLRTIGIIYVFFINIGWAHPGWGIVADKKGQIYFGDVNRNIIWKIDTKHSVSKFVTGKHSHDLRIDEEGNVYGEHVWYEQTMSEFHSSHWKATPDGVETEIPAEEGKRLFRILDHHGNEYRGEGSAHTRESRIMRVAPDGTASLFAGGRWGHADGQQVFQHSP